MFMGSSTFHAKLFIEGLSLRGLSIIFFFFWYFVTFLEKLSFTFQMALWATAQMAVSLFGSWGWCWDMSESLAFDQSRSQWRELAHFYHV